MTLTEDWQNRGHRGLHPSLANSALPHAPIGAQLFLEFL